MRIILSPGDSIVVGFQEHGVSLKSDVVLRFDKRGRLLLESPWPDEAGNKGIIYDSNRKNEYGNKIEVGE